MMDGIANLISYSTVLGTALALVLKSTLVIAIGLISMLILRNESASARHFVLGASLIAVLFLPAIQMFSPELPLPLLTQTSENTIVSSNDETRSDHQVLLVPQKAWNTQQNVSTAANEKMSPLNFIGAIYFAGVVISLLYLLTGIARVAWLTRNSSRANGTDGLSRLAAIQKHSVHIRFSREIDAPLTWGVLKPVILFPLDAMKWSADDQKHALLHEMAHVERKDWFTQIVGRLICALYWFNPLTWLTLRRLTLEAELAADDQVIAAGSSRDEYAQQLVELTQKTRSTTLPLAATTMAEQSLLYRRVYSILNAGEHSMVMTQRRKISLSSFVTIVALIVGSTTLVAAPQTATTDQSSNISSDLSTPLIRAAAAGNAEEVNRLIQTGVDVNETSSNRGKRNPLPRSALNAAARAGNTDSIAALLDAGAPVDRVVRGDPTALIEAANYDHLNAIRLLIERGADVNKVVRGDGSPLIASTRAGNVEAVQFILEQGAEPDRFVRGDENPLYHASVNGNTEILQLLIDAGVDIDQEWSGDGTALIVATRNGNADAVEALILAGARADQGVKRDGNAMIVAAQRGDTEMLQKMIATGADVNAAVKGDGSPLIQAARNGHMDAVVMLLQAGADIDQVVPGDENALIGAAWKGDVEMVDYLLRSGADPTIKARSYGQSRTALSQSRKKGHEEVVRLLEAAGATE